MTNELQTKTDNQIATQDDVSSGGIGREDIELPRASILQATSPDVRDGDAKEGTVINSITKEVMGDVFVPLFAYKQYAKFDDDGKLEWSTMDRTDSRVVEGLQWLDGNKPEVTEFVNLLVVFKSDPECPAILSFKRASLRAGRQFLTLLSIKGRGKPYYTSAYRLKLNKVVSGQNSYWVPKIVTAGDESAVDEELLQNCKSLHDSFKPIIRTLKVEEETATDSTESGDVPF